MIASDSTHTHRRGLNEVFMVLVKGYWVPAFHLQQNSKQLCQCWQTTEPGGPRASSSSGFVRLLCIVAFADIIQVSIYIKLERS